MSEIKINFGERKIHAFDIDGTLLPGALVERAFIELLSRGSLRLEDDEINNILHYRDTDPNEYVSQTVRGFSEGVKGVPIKYLRSVARDISERDIANIYPEMRSILDTIKSDSEDIVLISGSPRMFVEALGREIGATVSDGTHHYVARGVIHENRPRRKTIHEKDKHLTSICRSLGGQAISAYGDAMNDLPMLLSVPNPTAVNPLPGLREFAITEGWPIIDCHVLQDSN